MSRSLIATATEPGEIQVLSPRSFFLVVAVLLLTIGAALRVFHLGDRSLWYDEAVTANTSRGTLAQVLEETRQVSAPVIHPYILYLVEKIGTSPVAVRAPSVLASLLAVLLMLAMVRAKVSRNAALFSAAILAVSASQIRYAQEVREYSLAVLFATLLIYCLAQLGGRRFSKSSSRFAVCRPVYCAAYPIWFGFFCIRHSEHNRTSALVDSRHLFQSVSHSDRIGLSRRRRTIVLLSDPSLPVSRRENPVVSGRELF